MEEMLYESESATPKVAEESEHHAAAEEEVAVLTQTGEGPL